jgi:hypothetical protein
MKMRLLMENWSNYVAENEENTLDEGAMNKASAIPVLIAALWGGDAMKHGDVTTPVQHVFDVMQVVANDIPEGEEINAASFMKALASKLSEKASEVVSGEED